jgi:hypothetical protein
MTGTAAAQCGLFAHKSVPVIFEPPCITRVSMNKMGYRVNDIQFSCSVFLPKKSIFCAHGVCCFPHLSHSNYRMELTMFVFIVSGLVTDWSTSHNWPLACINIFYSE